MDSLGSLKRPRDATDMIVHEALQEELKKKEAKKRAKEGSKLNRRRVLTFAWEVRQLELGGLVHHPVASGTSGCCTHCTYALKAGKEANFHVVVLPGSAKLVLRLLARAGTGTTHASKTCSSALCARVTSAAY